MSSHEVSLEKLVCKPQFDTVVDLVITRCMLILRVSRGDVALADLVASCLVVCQTMCAHLCAATLPDPFVNVLQKFQSMVRIKSRSVPHSCSLNSMYDSQNACCITSAQLVSSGGWHSIDQQSTHRRWHCCSKRA